MTDLDAIRARHVPEPGGWCRHDLKMVDERDSAFTRSKTCEVAIVLAALDEAEEAAYIRGRQAILDALGTWLASTTLEATDAD